MPRLGGVELGLPLLERAGLRDEQRLRVERLEVRLLRREDDVLKGLVVLEVGGDEGLPRLFDGGGAAAEVEEEIAERDRRREVRGRRAGVDARADALAAQRRAEVDFRVVRRAPAAERSEEHTSELQSRLHLVCRL